MQPGGDGGGAGAAPLGTHYGACHPMELGWSLLVTEMVPCAERVRFTSSGTEATHMALRLARTFIGAWAGPQGPRGAILSATHGAAEIAEATEDWRKGLRMLRDEGELRH